MTYDFGANGWIELNSGHDTGIISTAAFNFIVQEPKEIIDFVNPTSLSANF